MFIEELWEKDPELVKKALKKVFNVNEKAGDRLDFSGMKDGVLSCAKYGEQFYEVAVSDYEISVALMNRYSKCDKLSKRWFKFMYNAVGDMYVYHYMAHRNEELDKIVDRHKKETATMLETVAFNPSKSKTK